MTQIDPPGKNSLRRGEEEDYFLLITPYIVCVYWFAVGRWWDWKDRDWVVIEKGNWFWAPAKKVQDILHAAH